MQMNVDASESVNTPDVNPTLICAAAENRGGDSITCHLEETTGIEQISVESGKTIHLTRSAQPFSFSLIPDNLVEVMDRHPFQVVVPSPSSDESSNARPSHS